MPPGRYSSGREVRAEFPEVLRHACAQDPRSVESRITAEAGHHYRKPRPQDLDTFRLSIIGSGGLPTRNHESQAITTDSVSAIPVRPNPK